MTGLCEEYRRQAAYCEKMADRSTSPDVMADWLRLAARWLAMIPHREGDAETRFASYVHERGTGQKDTGTSH